MNSTVLLAPRLNSGKITFALINALMDMLLYLIMFVNLALYLGAILVKKIGETVKNVKEKRFYTTTNALIPVLLVPTSFPQAHATLAEMTA
jgi:hypothetical protein